MTAAALESRFGDPRDEGNPLGFAAVLRADERGQMLPAGRAALDAFGFNAHFVPRTSGGRLHRADELAILLRPVFRRDAALGLGHGVANLIASATVWAAGEAEHQRLLADVLVGGGQARGVYGGPDTDYDLARSRIRASEHGNMLRVDGRIDLVDDVAAARYTTVLARTGDEADARNLSLLLVDMTAIDRGTVRFLPRSRTAGLRGMRLGGAEFHGTRVPSSTVVGVPGQALETVSRAARLTGAVLTGATVGCLDTQLRTVTRFATSRPRYSGTVAELPHARSLLTGAFADLLACDSIATTVCRALHLLPHQTRGYAAALQYLVPTMIEEAGDDLAVVLGARSFLREGEHAIFQKHRRDLPLIARAHAGPAACVASMLPQLRRSAAGDWFRSVPAPAALFRPSEELPDLDLRWSPAAACTDDPLLAVLVALAPELDGDPVLWPLCRVLLDDLCELRDRVLELPPYDATSPLEPAVFTLCERYAVILTASACLGTWWHQRDSTDPFIRDPGWLVAALGRLTERLGHAPLPGTRAAQDALLAELQARTNQDRALDLAECDLHPAYHLAEGVTP